MPSPTARSTFSLSGNRPSDTRRRRNGAAEQHGRRRHRRRDYGPLRCARALALRGIPVTVLEARTVRWSQLEKRWHGAHGFGRGQHTDASLRARRCAAHVFNVGQAVDTVESWSNRQPSIATSSVADMSRWLRSRLTTVASRRPRDCSRPRIRTPGPADTAPRLRDEIGSDLYHGGLLDPASASVNPARYVAGLALRWPPTRIHEMMPVTSLERLAPRWRVTTRSSRHDRCEVSSSQQAGTRAASPTLRRRIVPIGSARHRHGAFIGRACERGKSRAGACSTTRVFLHCFRLTPDADYFVRRPERGSCLRRARP